MRFRIIERKPPELIVEYAGFAGDWKQLTDENGQVVVFGSTDEAERVASTVQIGESKGKRVVRFWDTPFGILSEAEKK